MRQSAWTVASLAFWHTFASLPTREPVWSPVGEDSSPLSRSTRSHTRAAVSSRASRLPMALRRPPTAVSLQPSDVADLRAFIAQRDSTTAKGKGASLAEQEKQQREEREKKGTKARVLGDGQAS